MWTGHWSGLGASAMWKDKAEVGTVVLKSTIINGKVRSCHYTVAVVWTSHSNIAFVFWLSCGGFEIERSRAGPALCWIQEVDGTDAFFSCCTGMGPHKATNEEKHVV